MSYGHAIVWLDHREAVIIEFSALEHRVSRIRGAETTERLHVKSGKPGAGRAPDDVELFAAVVHAVSAPEILVVGPGTAKTSFEHFVRARHHDFAKRIVRVEPLDHPSDGQLLAHGRAFFHGFDQLNSSMHTSSTIVR